MFKYKYEFQSNPNKYFNLFTIWKYNFCFVYSNWVGIALEKLLLLIRLVQGLPADQMDFWTYDLKGVSRCLLVTSNTDQSATSFTNYQMVKIWWFDFSIPLGSLWSMDPLGPGLGTHEVRPYKVFKQDANVNKECWQLVASLETK